MCAAMAVLARKGRHRQMYDVDNHRLVAGCIPYRLKQKDEENNGNLEDRLEVLMISSPNRNDLIFPKGGWENDETVVQAACREAWEEAGVGGIIHEECLGKWEFRSKSRQSSCSVEGACRGYMFALEVTEELDSWPEETCYKRRWLSVSDAKKLCRYPWMYEALERCVKYLNQAALSASEDFCSAKPSEQEDLDNATDACVAIPIESSTMRDEAALPLSGACIDESFSWFPTNPSMTVFISP